MKLRNILAAAALVAAAGVQAQPQYVVIENPQVDLSTLKVDKDGYYVLFDGSSLDGWRGYCKNHIPSKWNIKDGFEIHDGHPTFNKVWTEPVNAREFAAELIKPKYQNGYVLPDMPA